MYKIGPADWTKPFEWSTSGCKLTWGSEGIYPKGCGGEHVTCVAASNKGTLLVTGDATDMINIYRNPCRPGGKSKSIKAHGSTVQTVVFSSDDTRLFSVAGADRCLMQWKLDVPEPTAAPNS